MWEIFCACCFYNQLCKLSCTRMALTYKNQNQSFKKKNSIAVVSSISFFWLKRFFKTHILYGFHGMHTASAKKGGKNERKSCDIDVMVLQQKTGINELVIKYPSRHMWFKTWEMICHERIYCHGHGNVIGHVCTVWRSRTYDRNTMLSYRNGRQSPDILEKKI